MLGVALPTLRAWDHRYGVGPRGRTSGGHRRYEPEDLARLSLMCELVRDGVPASDAAERVLLSPGPVKPPILAASLDLPTRRRGLYRAALDLDGSHCHDLLRDTVARTGVVPAWSGLAAPVLRRIGIRHAATGHLVEVEHLLSAVISRVLGSVPQPAGAVQTLLACAPDEQHTLPVEALCAALAEQGAPTRMLGARVPVSALNSAITRTGPRVVVLWSHHPDTADLDAVRAVTRTRPRPLLIVTAGPGWAPRSGLDDPPDLAAAVRMLLDALPAASTTAAPTV